MTLQEYNDMYKEPFAKKLYIVSSGGQVITNNEIISETMSITSALCSEANLRYGACESTMFKIQIANLDYDFTNEWLDVYIEPRTDADGYLVTSDGGYILTDAGERIALRTDISAQVKIGHFKVISDKPINDRRWRELTCYDAMYDILNMNVAEWYRTLTFPMTIKQFRDSFFASLGIGQETVTLLNDNYSFGDCFTFDDELSGKTVITSICEFNGVFGHMTADSTFDYVDLADAEELTLDYYVDGTGSYEDYVTDAITGIIARGSSDDDGITVGTTDNPYIIQANPLIYNPTSWDDLEDCLDDLLDVIKLQTFRPFTVTAYGNPALPLGTRLTINTRNQTIESYAIKKTMTGIQSLRDTYTASNDKVQPTSVNSLSSQFERTRTRTIQAEKQIVLKVQDDGTLALCELSANAETGQTAFIVKAGNFQVDADGNVTITGNLTSNNSLIFTASAEHIAPKTYNVINATIEETQSGDIWVIDKETINFCGPSGASNKFMEYVYSLNQVLDYLAINTGLKITDGSQGLETAIVKVSSWYPGQTYSGMFIDCPNNTSGVMDFKNWNSLNPTTYGTLRAAAFSVQSSKYVKDNIKAISEEDANKLLQLNPVTFDYKNGEKNQQGFIAEEVYKVLPYCVQVPRDYCEEKEKELSELVSIDYAKFVPYLVKQNQMQEKRIADLERQVKALNNAIEKLVIEKIVERGIE